MPSLLFTVALKDCKVDTFSAGGPGGQNQNRRSTGVRITHEPSGAVGESREHREQLRNKRAAFRRMAETAQFNRWVRAQAAQQMGFPGPEEIVEREMAHVATEYKVDDKWVPADTLEIKLESR